MTTRFVIRVSSALLRTVVASHAYPDIGRVRTSMRSSHRFGTMVASFLTGPGAFVA
jgi:hypothetical protein